VKSHRAKIEPRRAIEQKKGHTELRSKKRAAQSYTESTAIWRAELRSKYAGHAEIEGRAELRSKRSAAQSYRAKEGPRRATEQKEGHTELQSKYAGRASRIRRIRRIY
jgi:hypothetical protein